jgi:hypothetical protein
MKNIFIIFILLWTVSFQAQNKDEYILRGKLSNELDPGADCGYLKLATVTEFKIIYFSDKNYKNKNIAIIIPCPELYGENFFKRGKTYDLKVKIIKENSSNRDFDYTIQNTKTLEKYNDHNIYWGLSITPKK